METLSHTMPLIPPENNMPNIDIYKPPYANHTPIYSSPPQKGEKFSYRPTEAKISKIGKSGGKIPKAEAFFKPNTYHPYKKDQSQKEYDPFKYPQEQTFYPNYVPFKLP